jgi:hypothetical protein
MSNPILTTVNVMLVSLLIVQYLMMLIYGPEESKSKKHFWYQMIPFGYYYFISKFLLVTLCERIKYLRNSYKNLP